MMSKDRWEDILDGCDYNMAQEDVLRTMTMLRQEGEKEGKVVYINPEFASALRVFCSDPAFETAVVLLEVAPKLLSMFEFNSPKNPLFKYGLATYLSEDDDTSRKNKALSFNGG